MTKQCCPRDPEILSISAVAYSGERGRLCSFGEGDDLSWYRAWILWNVWGKGSNARPWSSLLEGSWLQSIWQPSCSHGRDRSIPDLLFPPHQKWGWLCLPEWSDVCCSVATRKEERLEGLVRASAGPCSASTGPASWMGSSFPILALKIFLKVFPSDLLTGCLLSEARGQRTSLRHQFLLIPFPKTQASPWGASHKNHPFWDSAPKSLPSSQTRGNQEGLETSAWALSADGDA